MNQAQRGAVEAAIGNAEDNLYRAELDMRRTGGIASIKNAEYIAELKQRLAELKEGL